MTEVGLQSALFPTAVKPAKAEETRPLPDFADLHDELQRHKHTTLQLLWEEYRAANPDGYGYSRFCYHYQQWRSQRDVVMRQQHRAGEKLFVDWAGAKIPIHSRDSDAVHEAPLFVAVLGASSYTYAEACWSQDMGCWIGAHVRTFEFIGGLPELVVPDNTRTGVSRACRYEPDLNPTYQEMAMHYGVGVLPARVRSRATKRRSKSGCRSCSVGSWPRCAIASSSRCKTSTWLSASYSPSSISGRFTNAKGRERRCSQRWTNQRYVHCPPNASISPSGPRHGQHRLPHPVRARLLQRALSTGAAGGRGACDSGGDRDLSQGHARGFACAAAQAVCGGDQPRSSSQVASRAPGLATLAHGAVGSQRRCPHCRSDR